MKALQQILILSLCLGMLLAACSSATPAPTPSPQPTLVPTALPQATQPVATVIPTPEPVEAGIPVIQYKDDRNALIVVSSKTGNVFEAFAPIPLGQNYYSYAFASDNRTLAVVSAGQLYLIDLPTWKYRTFDVNLHGQLGSVLYSPDESLLVLAGGEPEGDLRVVDAQSGAVKASAQLGFTIRAIKFTSDGSALMIYGPQIANSGVAKNAGVSVGAPKAALLAVSDLSVLWSTELDGIRAGTFPKNADVPVTQDIYQPGSAWYYQPGSAFDPRRDQLYLVHADEDRLTTVDYANRTVNAVDIHPELSWLDQLIALTAGVAHAKGMDGTVKQAVISADGKFLFVTGSTETVKDLGNNNWDFNLTSIGLQVIATADGALVDKIDTEAAWLNLSANGEQFFIIGWKQNVSYNTPWTDVYDMASRKLIKHLDNVDLTPSRLITGQPVLMSSYGVSENLCYLASVDPATWTVSDPWKVRTCYGWLISPYQASHFYP